MSRSPKEIQKKISKKLILFHTRPLKSFRISCFRTVTKLQISFENLSRRFRLIIDRIQYDLKPSSELN